MSNPFNEGGPRFFQTVFLADADMFIARMRAADREKLFRKIHQAERVRDPALFKKLSNEIWELRFRFGNLRLRVLAFWDKRQPTKTLVVATHAFVKKTDRVPEKEIEKAVRIRRFHFENTHNN